MIVTSKMVEDVKSLVKYLQHSEFTFDPNRELGNIKHLKITTKEDVKRMGISGEYKITTSGSTGEPLIINKTYQDYIWYIATMLREIKWLGWDVTKTVAIIDRNLEPRDYQSWGIMWAISPVQGARYVNSIIRTSELQAWLEEKNPHYIVAHPSVINSLNFKYPGSNYLDHKGSGEQNARSYSSAECGTIALECPDNPKVMHVMENNLVEVDEDGSIIITCLTNPGIRRYKHGDHIELGSCDCGRSLQTIAKIHGRIRNMFVMENGDTIWPSFGLKDGTFPSIKQYKVVQTDYNHIDVYIVLEPEQETPDESVLKQHIVKVLGVDLDVQITYLEGFYDYKHEEFISNVKVIN